MEPQPEVRTVRHKTTMVLLECNLYEPFQPETWDWKEVCEKSGMVMLPSESIRVVPPRHNGTELGHRLQALPVLTQEERDAVAGIALVIDRLKLYPEQLLRTKKDDLDLLWRIAEGKR